MLRNTLKFIFSCLIFLSSCTAFAAPVPYLLNYQGRLTDKATGVPVDNPSIGMKFSIYDVEQGGTPLWSEEHASVKVTKGIFNVLLGSVNQLNLTFDATKKYWLQVQVGADILLPRTQIVSVMHAANADMVDGYKIQGGLGSVTAAQAAGHLSTRVTFPKPFPTWVVSVVVTPSFNLHHQVVVTTSGWTKDGFDVWFSVPNWSYPAGAVQGFGWIAIGY